MSMRLIVITLFLGVVAACSSSEGRNIEPTDAPTASDAAVDSPAPAALTGLGQKCGADLPACPATAPDCIGFMGTTTFCTAKCVTNATGMTNAQGQLTSTTPPPDNASCAAAFTGTAGMPVCGVILAIMPEDNPLKANKNYTGIELGCVVACGANSACPTGMTCNAQGACLPD
ncbi:MAG: hypothetical protein ABL886_13395 [Rhodoglobus sp.]